MNYLMALSEALWERATQQAGPEVTALFSAYIEVEALITWLKGCWTVSTRVLYILRPFWIASHYDIESKGFNESVATNLLIGISSGNEGRLSSAPVGSGCGLKRPADRENVHA
jgi:hypothetical protein